jgi:DNA-binding FadR family transcriptional regulator
MNAKVSVTAYREAGALHEPKRIHDHAAFRLGAAIVSGQYPPGSRLPNEVESAEKLGICRSSYREATRILTAKGLLISRPKIGTVISPRSAWSQLDPDVLAWTFLSGPTEDYINDLFELRMVVEPAAASIAARKRSEDQVAIMADCLDVMRSETLATEDGRAADRLFHTTILEATGNEIMMSLSSGIGAAARWATAFKQRNRALPRDPLPDHVRVWEAIRTQDADAARSAAITLLLLAQEDTRLSMT